jgi:lipid-A-disaccharide synthase
MNPPSFMLIAGEPSGDALGAQLVGELRRTFARTAFAPRFFGAGGPRLAAAGVTLEFDLTRHAVTGFVEVFRQLRKFRRLLRRLLEVACTRQPDVIVLVDFQAFNRRFARALRRRLAAATGPFVNWHPRLVQFVSPQVWASRPQRAYDLAEDIDLLLCLFPFEQRWYARHRPNLRVEVVGHPLLDRYPGLPPAGTLPPIPTRHPPLIALLPGSRTDELRRHLPVLLETARRLAARDELRFRIVLPEDTLRPLAEAAVRDGPVEAALEVGGLGRTLSEATLALASTGTVTLECALFRVPTVALYITSGLTYWIGRRLATVKYLAMPNLLAGTRVMPEFIQDAATPENLAAAATELLHHPVLREAFRHKLDEVVAQLGGPGATRRAARAIARLDSPALAGKLGV